MLLAFFKDVSTTASSVIYIVWLRKALFFPGAVNLGPFSCSKIKIEKQKTKNQNNKQTTFLFMPSGVKTHTIFFFSWTDCHSS